jgi:choline dehydrogenase-like flavoprotein
VSSIKASRSADRPPPGLQPCRPRTAFFSPLLRFDDPQPPGLGAGAGPRDEPAEGERGLGRVAEPLGDHACPPGQDRGAVHAARFPNGLANGSGQVGRNYMRHTTGSVYAVFDKPVHMYRGTTMAGIVRDEARNDPKRGFVGGYELETLSLGLPFMAAFLNPGAWGRSFTSAIDDYANMAGLWIVGEHMPREQNRVTLDAKVKDANGMPVASVHFDDHENDEKMRNHAYRQGAAIYQAVGAVRTFPTPPYPSTHNLDTNRMSSNPRDGVANKWGQTHDIKNLFVSDGSQFATGAACNPTLTIVALAIRQADAIAGMMSRKEI